ncbi:hypothetical protein [Streptomyces sp. C10-9-1]|uniref:hypothetical protein n=1 Tax=Streptomyces sp. C10-9-1 TaxID=1859285 RepID=UPI003D75E69B
MITQYASRLATTLSAAGALVLTLSPQAQAGAIGTTPVHSFEYSVGGVTMKVPTGCTFTHIIRGGGKITYQNAGVDCGFVAALSSGFCNWRIDFTYAGTTNKTYKTSRAKDTRQVHDRPDAEQLSTDAPSLRKGMRAPLRQRGAAGEPVPPHHEVRGRS